MNKKIVALIPARGGSKEIPHKNLQSVRGKSLIHRAVKTALCSKVDEVWVSTDDKKISDAAIDAGATACVKRPSELCQDTSNSEDALLHFAEQVDFDLLVFMQCTSPLTDARDLNNAIEMTEEYDSVISVCKDSGGWLCGGFTWRDDPKGAVRTNTYMHQRQDREEQYRENGSLYITTRAGLMDSKSRLSGKVGMYVMPQSRSFEIDSIEDLEFIDRYLAYEEPSVIVHHPGKRIVNLM